MQSQLTVPLLNTLFTEKHNNVLDSGELLLMKTRLMPRKASFDVLN